MAWIGFFACLICIQLVTVNIHALPAATTPSPTTHIVSYVHLKRAKQRNNNELLNSHLESAPNHMVDKSAKLIEPPPLTDDSTDLQLNTLENTKEIFGRNDGVTDRNHPTESNATLSNEADLKNRNKHTISVLEPVRHLVNSLRDGALNHTIPHNRNHQHQLIAGSNGMSNSMTEEAKPENETSAIETEKDRELANESTEFQVLDVLGMLGSMIWSFIMNLQRIFAASSGNASGASSSSSSGGGNS